MRRALGILLIVALAVRSLVAIGYMPAVTAEDGSVTIVICSAGGPQLVKLDGSGAPQEPSHHSDEACAFGCIAGVLPPMLAHQRVPVAVAEAVPELAGETTLPPARAGPAHGSRAPPALS